MESSDLPCCFKSQVPESLNNQVETPFHTPPPGSIMLTIEPRMVKKIWAHSPISFSKCLFYLKSLNPSWEEVDHLAIFETPSVQVKGSILMQSLHFGLSHNSQI